MILRAGDLNDFVAKVDQLGGPGTPAANEYWSDFRYESARLPDVSLDPFSEEYFSQQIALYTELSGRPLCQEVNESTDFDMERHVNGCNSYAVDHPSVFVKHYQRFVEIVAHAGLPPNSSVLDFGCGWGLSSEFLASLGSKVTAIDINPKFVELVNRRAQRLGLPIKAQQGTFESINTQERFDLIFYYECLHHALRPWEAIAYASSLLKPKGTIAFAGEPVQAVWWPHWGLRLDPLSIYCIRKYGWFESGWSKDFISECFFRNGFIVNSWVRPDFENEFFLIANLHKYESLNLKIFVESGYGWLYDGGYAISKGQSSFNLDVFPQTGYILIELYNFRQKNVNVTLKIDDSVLKQSVLEPGKNIMSIDLAEIYAHPLKSRNLKLVSDSWSPAVELGSADSRWISFHLKEIRYSTSSTLSN